MLHFRVALLICPYKVKEIKQQNRVFIDISICKMKDLFVPFFVYFLRTRLLLILSLFSVKNASFKSKERV